MLTAAGRPGRVGRQPFTVATRGTATERTMEIRALMSAADASAAWDLRCEIREKLIDFIQRQYPDSLPRIRGEISTETVTD